MNGVPTLFSEQSLVVVRVRVQILPQRYFLTLKISRARAHNDCTRARVLCARAREQKQRLDTTTTTARAGGRANIRLDSII